MPCSSNTRIRPKMVSVEHIGIFAAIFTWGICNLFLLLVLVSAMVQRRTLELIRAGLFLKCLAMTIAINILAYSMYAGTPIVYWQEYPFFVVMVTAMGAIGALMVSAALLKR